MCGLFAMFDLQPGDDFVALRRQALELSQRQRHRGPDWSGVFVDAGVILVHERLANTHLHAISQQEELPLGRLAS